MRIFRKVAQNFDFKNDVADGEFLKKDGTALVGDTPGGGFSLGASNLGNTAGQTGVTGSQVVLVGTGNITLSQLTDANGGTISLSAGTVAGAAFSAGVSGGNTAGDTGATGTRVVFAGGNGITLSQATNANGGTVSIVGNTFSQSVQPETQTFLGGISASDALFTSGTVRLTGVGGGVTVSSNTGQRVDISVAAPVAQTVQTQNLHNVTLSGNTAGAMAHVSSGTLTLAGGNNITLSQNGNAVTISGPNVAGAQTGISGLANSQTTYTSGTVSLSELGAITIRSTTGNQFQFSVNSQSVQPETQTFVSGIIASDTTYTSGNIRFTGVGGGITVSSNTGQRVDLSVAAPVAQTDQTLGLYAVGNTTGQSSSTTRDARTLSFRGGGDISVGYSNGSIQISGPAQTAQTGISGLANSQTTYTSGTVSLSELGAITIRSTTGNQFQFSVNAQTGTQFSAGISGGNTAGDTGTVAGRVVLAGGANITLSGSTNGSSETISIVGPTQTVESQSIGASNLGNTLGTSGVASGAQVRAVVIGTSNITVSQSVNGASATLSLIGQPSFSGGVSNLGNSAGATGVSGTRLVLVGSNNITLSQTTGTAGATVSFIGGAGSGSDTDSTAITQTGHGLAVGDWVRMSGTNYVKAQADSEANAEVVGVVSAVADADNFTLITGGLVTGLSGLTAGAVYYLSASTAGAITSTEPSTAGQISKPIFIARSTTSGYVFNMRGNIIPASAITAFLAGLSNVGNTSGDTGITGSRLVLAGGNNVTLSGSTNASGGTVTISVPNLGAGAMSAGASNLGNTAGSTGITGTQLVMVGSGVISLSQSTGANGGTLSINAPATSSLVGTSGVSLSSNGSTISAMLPIVSSYAPYDESPMVTGQQGQGTVHFSPFRPPNLQFDRIALGVQVSNATNSSGSFTLSYAVGIYTQNVSTLSLLSSTSVSTNFTGSGTAGSYSRYGGPRHLTIPWTMTLTGSDYWIGLVSRTTSGGANVSVSQLLLSKFTTDPWSGIMGTASQSSDQRLLGLGVWSATSSSVPASAAFTNILGSGSIVLRAPVWHLRSGTV